MKHSTDFDLMVIGAGSAGLTAAYVALGLGKRVALVENERIGGECTFTGCVPSKTLLASARAAAVTARLPEFGVRAEADIELDTSGVFAHIGEVVSRIAADHLPEEMEAEGIRVLLGDARFEDPNTLRVGEQTFTASRFILATGSRPRVPDVAGLAEAGYLDNQSIWDLDEVPDSIAILGGGVIAAEVGLALARLGAAVTIVQSRDRILPREDAELAERLTAVLVSEGITIITNTRVKRVTRAGMLATLFDAEGAPIVSAREVLVATGRAPNTDLGLEAAGVRYGERGIAVDQHMRTSARHIYAAGDVVGPYRFTHVAERQAISATLSAVLPVGRAVRYDDLVWVIFTDPELAHLGLTEEEARARHGDEIDVYRYEFAHQDRARAEVASAGIAKYIVGRDKRLLGAHILGERAGEMIAEAVIVKQRGLPFSALSSVMHAYPTFSDAVKRPADRASIAELRRSTLVRMAQRLTSGGPGGDIPV
ncbi:MAG: FAD-dependent oxidoreductase [Anaerosomatales bacterium]|nr:FAD-dependent oxidoreductase [Anaerosomatales bacterium]MDT8434591.1 FAD-dependent oxidoreductase [Anaerosomatales bacterium]